MSGREVHVVGSGLAGLYAAYAAAYNGADVSLYERLKEKRINCGELFTEIYSAAPEECIVNRIRFFDFKIKDEIARIDFGENSPFIMTDKKLHEETILNKCIALGVKVNFGYKYKFYNGLPVNGIVIDASGVRGINNYSSDEGVAVTYTITRSRAKGSNGNKIMIDNDTALFELRSDLKGYKWYFPKGKLMNIGDGIYDYRGSKNFIKPDDVVYHSRGGGFLPMPDMKTYYNNIKEAGDCSSRNLIRVGNAAGLVDPILGGGEHLATISGILAGCLAANKDELSYTTALNEIIGDEMRIGISMYELLKKFDFDSIYEFMGNLRAFKTLSVFNSVNKTIRPAMRKWITIPISTNLDLENYLKE